ncbi:septum formation protein [Thermotomaculum hydrothermale]|uniref:dTTP/UTP pyrophosphatase n=1 Tax=Thermotomaculum hydrothermale TaxID=981385 RepID=A0A7R6PQI1_9BACT|nr:Maf family protein [Thermotomaculum hydrothermale]BBB32501.1 septum formation protein [Thermotomaculum hydrothermale]
MFVLASKSPRRLELLKTIIPDLEVIHPEVDETSIKSKNPANLVMKLSQAKGRFVLKKHNKENVIAADTVVVLDNEILEKPKDREDAKNILRKLSGKTHKVITGVSVFIKDFCFSFYDETQVEFYELTDEEIEWYISTNEPMDKAGAYGIQGHGKIFIRSIKGDYFNVVGFPIAKFYQKLKKNKINLPFLKKD